MRTAGTRNSPRVGAPAEAPGSCARPARWSAHVRSALGAVQVVGVLLDHPLDGVGQAAGPARVRGVPADTKFAPWCPSTEVRRRRRSGSVDRVAANRKRNRAVGSYTAAETPTSWLVEYHAGAVEDLKSFGAREQKGALIVVDFLSQLGIKIKEPHMKPLQGEKKLRELRPGGGKTLIRPLYFQLDRRTFKIVAIGPEAMTDPVGFKSAVARAKGRAKRDYGVET